jgi:FXSXX-COOH protein
MLPTAEIGLIAPIADLQNTSLTEMSALSTEMLHRAIGNVLPETITAPVPVAAFNSAIA